MFCSSELTKKELKMSPNCCRECLDDHHEKMRKQFALAVSSALKSTKGKK